MNQLSIILYGFVVKELFFLQLFAISGKMDIDLVKTRVITDDLVKGVVYILGILFVCCLY
jgi:hypothetical protein